jgi:putative CocE/NonD family hydrolase
LNDEVVAPPDTEYYTELAYQVRVVEHIWISMSDDCRLSAKLWLPVTPDGESAPTILEYIPYRKGDATAPRDQLNHAYFAGHGYASVRVDMRGTGNSDGLQMDEYLPIEQRDGQEVLDWLVRQPWCDGSIGMFGISWGGVSALQAATFAHPALKAIIPVCATDDRYYDDGCYFLGCMSGETLGWGAVMLGFNSRPPDPEVVGDGWRSQWLERLQEPPLFLETFLRHQRRDEYWLQGTVRDNYDSIQCAVYAMGGWADCWPNTVFRLLENLPDATPKKGLSGAWGHTYPHVGVPGPAIGFLPEALRWWDHWLKGIDNGIEREPEFVGYLRTLTPPNARHAMSPGCWVSQTRWTGSESGYVRYYFGDGVLSQTRPTGTPVVVSSPQSCGLDAGEYMPWYMSGPASQLPLDQRGDDSKSVTFDGAVLDTPLDILGTPCAELDVTTDTFSGLVAVRLCDVWPDGASTLISFGVLNLAQRDGRDAPLPVTPGSPYRVRVRLNDTGYRVAIGHRLRLGVSTSYWPIAWPPPEPLRLTLDSRTSHLELPLLDKAASELGGMPFEPPRTPPPLAMTTLAPGRQERTITHDVETDEFIFSTVKDAGRTLLHHNKIEMASSTTERYSIVDNDPLTARARYTCDYAVGRGDWQTRTQGVATITCSRDSFFVQASLSAFEGDNEVSTRSWDLEIPRDGF